MQLDGDGRRAGVQHELGDLVVSFDLRRGEADGEEDGGAAGDDALAGENREDAGGVLCDGEEHGGVAVVLKGHLNGYIWREGGRGQEWEEGETGGRGVFESCMRLTVW